MTRRIALLTLMLLGMLRFFRRLTFRFLLSFLCTSMLVGLCTKLFDHFAGYTLTVASISETGFFKRLLKSFHCGIFQAPVGVVSFLKLRLKDCTTITETVPTLSVFTGGPLGLAPFGLRAGNITRRVSARGITPSLGLLLLPSAGLWH